MELYNNFLRGEVYVRKEDMINLNRLLELVQLNMKIPTGQIVTS